MAHIYYLTALAVLTFLMTKCAQIMFDLGYKWSVKDYFFEFLTKTSMASVFHLPFYLKSNMI